jgi:transposase
MKRSSKKSGSQAVNKIMEERSRFVIVAIDFAKKSMKVQASLDRDTVAWKRGLDVDNTQDGLELLLGKLDGICRKWRVKPGRLIFGGEDPAPYAMPFIESLKRRGFLFIAVSALKASINRDNTRASSDLLDLDGIAETMRKGVVRDIEASSSVYTELRQACRARQQADDMETCIGNQIRRIADLVFLELLDEKVSGLTPLGSASLALLEQGMTPARLQKMTDVALLKLLRKCGAVRPEEVLHSLRKIALRALPAPQDLGYLQETLKCKIATLRTIRQEIACNERQMARCLLQTPCAWLLTIPGAGVVLVANVIAELGDPVRWRSVEQVFSYAGCARRQKQTGGPDKEPHGIGMPKNCNRRLKNALLQLAYHVGTTPHPAGKSTETGGSHRLLQHYQKVEARGGCSKLATARLLLRIGFQMVRSETPYQPPWDGNEELPSKETRIAWMNAAMETAISKVRKPDLDGIPDDVNKIKAFKKFAKEYADNVDSANL